jgi:hypothetical protein
MYIFTQQKQPNPVPEPPGFLGYLVTVCGCLGYAKQIPIGWALLLSAGLFDNNPTCVPISIQTDKISDPRQELSYTPGRFAAD